MKKQLVFISLFIHCCFVFSQNYTWLRGSSSGSIASVYGTQGVAAPGNDPGGRHGCATWTDAAGNMWLFGGEGYASNTTISWLNDLWKYNPTTNQWTWIRGSNGPNAQGVYGIQGVASPANDPGAREFCRGWADAAGNFWLYAGDGYGASSTFGRLADLWKYDPLTNQWTWMKGPNTVNAPPVFGTQGVSSPANIPTARYWPTAWVDNNGKFWIFGGRGYISFTNQGRLSDLWRYDPVTNEWTWMEGSTAVDVSGVYGTQGTAAPTNFPGGRDCASSFISPQGHLVLFGGQGLGSAPGAGFLNDLWEYNISTGNWTWTKGSTVTGQVGIYGTIGIPGAAVNPGGKASAACWTDMMGNYWIFGGDGLASTNFASNQNDLFMFNPNTNNWTWIKGSNQPNQNGTYGTQGVAAPANTPGGRYYNSWWVNPSSAYLWLMGGLGYDATSNFSDNMNDLWKFKVPCNPDSAKAVPQSICSGKTASLTAYNLYPSQVYWYLSPSASATIGSGSAFTTPSLTSPGTPSVYTFYAGYTACTVSPRAVVNVTVLPLPLLNSTSPSSLCPGQTGVATASGAVSYLWNNGAQTSTIAISGGTVMSSFTCTGTGVNGCTDLMTLTVGVHPVPNISAGSSRDPGCTGETVTLTAGGATSYTWNGTDVTPSIVVSPTITTTYTVEGTNQFGCRAAKTFTQLVVFCVGLEEQSNELNTIMIYPNPNNGNFKLAVSEQASFLLLNVAGRTLIKTAAEPGTSEISTQLKQGIYFYRIITQTGKVSNGKLVVED